MVSSSIKLAFLASPVAQWEGPSFRWSLNKTGADSPMTAESFPTDPLGLPEAGRPQLLELADGDTLGAAGGPGGQAAG